MQPPFLGPGHRCSRAKCNCLSSGRRQQAPEGEGSLQTPRDASRVRTKAVSLAPGPYGERTGIPGFSCSPGPHNASMTGSGMPHGTPGQAPRGAGRAPRWLHPLCLCHMVPAEQPGPRLPGRQLLPSIHPEAPQDSQVQGGLVNGESPGQEEARGAGAVVGTWGEPPPVLQGQSGGCNGDLM